MPAVQLARLKNQIELLGGLFSRPDEFRKALYELLDQYSDHTYRTSDTVNTSIPVEDSFHTSQVVLSQVELGFGRWTQQNPATAIELAGMLWKDSKAELRLLAAYLIGIVPIQSQPQVLEEIRGWAEAEDNKFFLQALFRNGTAITRQKNTRPWLEIIQGWISSPGLKSQRLGLLAMRPLVEDATFQNLPNLFNGVGHVIREHPRQLQNELAVLLVELARRSPIETVYFLRQMLGLGISPDLLRLIRYCLPDFPEEVQTRVRVILHSLKGRD